MNVPPVSDESLSEMFDRAFRICTDIDSTSVPSNSDEFRRQARKAILMLEDATRLVSLLDIFSRNETVSEVKSEHLKYFLLPALLADLNSKTVDDNRLDVVKVVEVYYVDFLQRVKDYEFKFSVEIPNTKDDEDVDNAEAFGHRPDFSKMTRDRDATIRRYNDRKAIDAALETLSAKSDDDNVVRNFYMKTIEKFVYLAVDELNSLATEKSILKHMSSIRPHNESPVTAGVEAKRRPLKPIIITRDAIQKEVFGMGYKNLPIFTIEEFYEQRVREGWFPDPAAQSRQHNTLQDRFNNEDSAKIQEEKEVAASEAREDADDPDELERKRAFDEYKDDHRRGEGNRHNRG